MDDFADMFDQYLKNSGMIYADGFDTPPLPEVTETKPDTRGEPFKNANRYTMPATHGRYWLK